METEKLVVYGAIGYVAYKLLVPPRVVIPGGGAGYYPTPVPPRPSTGEKATDAALAVAQTYGVDACISAGYDPATCRQAGTSVGGLLDDLFNF